MEINPYLAASAIISISIAAYLILFRLKKN